MTTEKTDFKRLLMDNRVIYVLLTILIIAVMLSPLGLPIKTLQTSRDVVDYLDNLPSGSVVAIAFDMIPSAWTEIGSSHVALAKHLLSLDVKFFYFSVVEQGPMVINNLLDKVDFSDKEYGVDYAIFGFLPGSETAVNSLAQKTREMLVADMYGAPIDDLPVMDGINSAEDVDLLMTTASTATYEYYVPHWVQAYGTPAICLAGGGQYPSILNYMALGLYEGGLNGQRGGADYEFLINRPGNAIKLMDIQTILHYLLIVFIVGSNVSHLINRSGKK